MTGGDVATLTKKPVVLFLCTHNSARSQMAEALLRECANDAFDIYSAGMDPTEIHPLTVRVMAEVGIDVSGQKAKGLRQFLGRLPVRLLIIVCHEAEESCPRLWPGALERLYWPFEDPAAADGTDEGKLEKFRSVRNQIEGRIRSWTEEMGLRTPR